MLNLARELEVVRRTNLTLVVVRAAGHDPIKATGLLLAHLDYVVAQTSPARAQVWDLAARNRPAHDPYDLIARIAVHQNRDPESVRRQARLTQAEFRHDPLAD
jgi:hypothetical protein